MLTWQAAAHVALDLMPPCTRKTMRNKVQTLHTDFHPLPVSTSVMFVSQFWCYIREHGSERRRQGQRGVCVMQHETVCRITCAGRSLQERGRRRGGGERGKKGECSSEESQSLSPHFSRRDDCVLSPSAWGVCRVGGMCVCWSWRALQGPRLLLSPDPEPCAVLGRPVPSVPGLGSLWEGGEVEGARRSRGLGGRHGGVLARKGLEGDLCGSMRLFFVGSGSFWHALHS